MHIAARLIEKGANVNETGDIGTTPLLAAINRDQLYIAARLIEKEADVNKGGENPKQHRC